METITESAALVALLKSKPNGKTWHQMTTEVLENASAIRVWHCQSQPALVELDEDNQPLITAAAEVARWSETGNRLLTILDGDYPKRLRDIWQAPPILFARGAVLSDDCGVSVVGSRAASSRGRMMARTISIALVERKLSVLSGLAKGIDTEAHTAALESGGRTVAFLGTGIDRTYPAENRELQEQIASEGLLLSQFWPEAPPTKHSFPMRNAVMSGYGLATIVVEAGEHSGARIQARLAVQHGRPVILTDHVVESTQWGQDLLTSPGVYMASNPVQVTDIIDRLVAEEQAMESALVGFGDVG